MRRAASLDGDIPRRVGPLGGEDALASAGAGHGATNLRGLAPEAFAYQPAFDGNAADITDAPSGGRGLVLPRHVGREERGRAPRPDFTATNASGDVEPAC